MIVSVTGASGFIGRHAAARLLAAGHTVRVLSRTGRSLAGCETFLGNLGKDPAEVFAKFLDGADVVVNCAGEIKSEASMRAVHVDGVRTLLSAAVGRVRRWVQLSSVGVYGAVRNGLVTETSEEAPVGAYEHTKALSDKIVTEAARRGEIEGVLLRPSIVFASDMPNSSLRQMAALVRRGMFFFVGAPGAEALARCCEMEAASGQVFNLSGWTTIEAFVAGMAKGLGAPAPAARAPEWLVQSTARLGCTLAPRFPLTPSRVDALTSRATYSADHIRDVLGFSVREPIEESMAKVAAEWRIR
jgi:nucleoside-diphosphate-sugar epimerase